MPSVPSHSTLKGWPRAPLGARGANLRGMGHDDDAPRRSQMGLGGRPQAVQGQILRGQRQSRIPGEPTARRGRLQPVPKASHGNVRRSDKSFSDGFADHERSNFHAMDVLNTEVAQHAHFQARMTAQAEHRVSAQIRLRTPARCQQRCRQARVYEARHQRRQAVVPLSPQSRIHPCGALSPPGSLLGG